MSHMVHVRDFEINSLAALQAACRRLGFVFQKGKTEACYYNGQKAHVNHAIAVLGAEWEIGVLEEKKNGRTTYSICADFYGTTGKKMKQAVNQLRQAYAVELAKEVAGKKGYAVREQKLSDGSIRLVVEVRG